ncbi:hypothetical protein [Microbispora catharanthi]|uniref:MAE-28990/MAE-18760-like HEPN domain-containing protein n=1 Tax=Microbispora catharanthi TaxID=1712871 RepID=A0A5N6BCX6_9ACTN|nr:hypothetical protein [Microbispora catharanthi]KAB8178335.1 hypothetical protein FH610_036835 [Microbispora catharanthi]
MMLDITENALEELIATYARHITTTAGRRPGRPLRRFRDDTVGDTAAADRAACWLRLVSIVEIYVETLLRRLDGKEAGKAPRGWDDVVKALKTRHAIDASDAEGWAKLESCIIVRNAVAHGLGRFTPNQLKQEKPRKVRLIDVPVRDGAVVVTSEALAGCVETCRGFVTALDRTSQSV